MELSMSIIADKLSCYSPDVSIVSGKRNIRGVRPLLSVEKLRKDILYVSESCRPGDDYVLCTHGMDWMKLHTDDMEEVLTAILDIFEAFQQWVAELGRAVENGAGIQRYIDVSGYALPFPTVISDSFGNVVAYSKNFGVGEVDDYWDSVVEQRQMDDRVFEETVFDEQYEKVRDWDTTPRIYVTMQNRIIAMHLTLGNEVVGSLMVIEAGGRLSTGLCQILEVFRDTVSKALRVRGEDAELRTVMAAAEEYLDGKPVDARRLWDRIIEVTRAGEEEQELILLKNLNRVDFNYRNHTAYRLSNSGYRCFGMVFHEYVAAIIRCDAEKEFLADIRQLLHGNEFICGISLPFSNVETMKRAGNQAALAVLSGSQAPGAVSRCVDHAYTYLINKLAGDKSFGTELLHPGLARLKKYDEKHGTGFYDTLYQYLIMERNVVATAKRLFIHRNSMLYRLQRISQLLDVDLDDPDMRVYLQLSYQIERAMDNQRTADLFAVDSPWADQCKQLFWEDIQQKI